MKHLIIVSILVFSGSAFATDYLVEDGDVFGDWILVDHDTFLMTGGGIRCLWVIGQQQPSKILRP
jgi:hypothetical protein